MYKSKISKVVPVAPSKDKGSSPLKTSGPINYNNWIHHLYNSSSKQNGELHALSTLRQLSASFSRKKRADPDTVEHLLGE